MNKKSTRTKAEKGQNEIKSSGHREMDARDEEY